MILLDGSIIPAGPFIAAIVGGALGALLAVWMVLRGLSYAGLPGLRHRKPGFLAALIILGLPALWLGGEDKWHWLYWVELHYDYETRAMTLNIVTIVLLVIGFVVGLWLSPKRKSAPE